MLTRLSRAFLRVFPAILLVVVGLLAALFRRRGGSGKVATTRVPVPSRHTTTPVRHRGASIALLALLLGVGLILVLVGGNGDLWRFGAPPPTSDGESRQPVASLPRLNVDGRPGNTADAVAPGGSATKPTLGEPAAAMAPGAPDPSFPSFDTVRVEPNGELVVAGRATPNGTVELLVDGKPTARAVVDANGRFAIVPPPLPSGNSEVGLRVTDGKGVVRQSRDSVAVVVSTSHDTRPLVALTSPDKPTVVLSQPDPSQTATRSVPDAMSPRRTMTGTASPAQRGARGAVPADGASGSLAANDAARSSWTGNGDSPDAKVSDQGASSGGRSGPSDAPQATPPERAVVAGSASASTKVVSVDAHEGNRLFVSGQAPAGATVRLYLNDTLVAPATVGRDGTVTFTIGGGVKPGDYKVRLDQVDAASGKVHTRVEVPFSVPDNAGTVGTGRAVAKPSEPAPDKAGAGKVESNASSPATVGAFSATILPSALKACDANGTCLIRIGLGPTLSGRQSSKRYRGTCALELPS